MCKVEKEITDFAKTKNSKSGYTPQCKKCRDIVTQRGRIGNVNYKLKEAKRSAFRRGHDWQLSDELAKNFFKQIALIAG